VGDVQKACTDANTESGDDALYVFGDFKHLSAA